MGRLARILLFGLLPALLPACLPESRNPVTPVEAAIPDDRLIGLWSGQVADEKIFLHVLKADHNKLDILVVSHRPDGGGAIDRYQGHISALGDRRFVNLQAVEDSTVDDSNPDLSFLIVGYDLAGPDRLVTRFLAEQPLVDGIAAGALTGEVTDEGEALGRSIVLSSDSADLAKYLAAGDSAAIFDRSVEFVRVSASN
jgi:hypothetical protein